MEVWKSIKGYESLYEVSDRGRIRSLPKVDMRGYKRKERILNPGINSRGYRTVMLYKEGKKKNFLVHRLVADAFLPNPENKAEVNHIDGNKLNNTLENLEWLTRTENMQHAFATGLNRGHDGARGEKQGNSKLKEEQVREIYKRAKQGEKHKILADEFGVCRQLIYDIKVGRRWSWLTGQINQESILASFRQIDIDSPDHKFF